MILDLETAIKLGLDTKRAQYSKFGGVPDVDADRAEILETSFAWIIPWNARRYVETRNDADLIDGLHPLVVFKADGRVSDLPSLTRSRNEVDSIGPMHMLEQRISYLAKVLGIKWDGVCSRPNSVP